MKQLYFLLLTLSAGAALGADYQNPQIRAISPPQCVGVDAIRSQFAPLLVDNQFHLVVRHLGDPGSPELYGEVANAVTWDVGQYTGFSAPEPRAYWQRGYYNYGPPTGSSAFQAHCYNMGSMINTWWFPHTSPIIGGGPHSAYEVRYSNPQTPWRTASSELTLQAHHIKIPWAATWNGGVGQLSFFAYLRDSVTGRLFAYVMQIFDTRPFGQDNGREFVSHDTQVAFVSVPFTSNLRYATVSPFSNMMRNVSPWSTGDFFRIHISASKLQAAINAVNQQYPGTLSATPKPGCAFTACNYELHSAGVLHEVGVGMSPSANVSMGVNIYGFAVYEFY